MILRKVKCTNRVFAFLALAMFASFPAVAAAQTSEPTPCAILLHGITKGRESMAPLAQALLENGYYVVNLDYPSRKQPIEQLAASTIPRGLAACKQAGASPINFVVHSMGSLLLRQYYAQRSAGEVHRAVMLGPPNRGSRLGNFLSCIPWIKDLNGPAGKQMGVDPQSVPSQLGPIPFATGVIAGTRSYNPLFAAIIRGDDDGRVGVPSTYVQGVCARMTLPVTHGGLTEDRRVAPEVLRYLRSGRFSVDEAEYFSCAGDP